MSGDQKRVTAIAKCRIGRRPFSKRASGLTAPASEIAWPRLVPRPTHVSVLTAHRLIPIQWQLRSNQELLTASRAP